MTPFRSGFITIIGRPNVGKSTLVNALLGQKIAAVSAKAQTTRRRQMGILTTETYQMVFVDTPGMHQARYKLGNFLNQEAEAALDGVDIILFLVDASAQPGEDDQRIATQLAGRKRGRNATLMLGLNKTDLLSAEALATRRTEYGNLLPEAILVPFSATSGWGLDALLGTFVEHLTEREAEFPEEQVTDAYERDIAADLIREAALNYLHEEVPHGVAIRIDEFKERENGMAYIAATLFVERDSHKGIAIGEGGGMLRKIGAAARKEIEAMGGRPVYLELRVKVLKDWRNNEDYLKRFGMKPKEK
jgi:GTPase